MTQFYKNSNGIKSVHKQESLLFEKEYSPPDYGTNLLSRLYSDGGLYYLSQIEELQSDDIVEKWNYISTISTKGLQQILAILKKCCKVRNEVKVSGNSVGTAIWRIQCNKIINEIIITGIPDSKFKGFIEIDNLINSNIQNIPADK